MPDTIDSSNDANASLVRPSDQDGRVLVNWLFPIYLLAVLAGIGVLSKFGSTMAGRPLNTPQSVFTAVDAATLSGFRSTGSIVPALEDLVPRAQVVVILLNIAGALFTLTAGGISVSRILRLKFSPRQIAGAAGKWLALAAVIGLLFFRGTGEIAGIQILSGLSRGVAAFGNYGTSVGRYPLGLHDWRSWLLVLPLTVVGGMGITVLLELVNFRTHRRLSRHARTVIAWVFGLYLIGTLTFVVLQLHGMALTRVDHTHENYLHVLLAIGRNPDKMREIWATSSAMAIVTRTAGISYKFGYAFPRAMEWLMMLYMVIGASSGGTGGGLKTTTVAAIFEGTRKLLLGGAPGRQLGFAITWVGIYAGMIFFGLIALLISQPQTNADQLLMMTISAVGNVGLTHDQLSPSIGGMLILSGLMLAGRVVPLMMLMWMANSTDDAELAIG